ncbi:hypothetical protein GOODEAATRI_033221, partial [Goodea atripinnis]
RGSETQDEAAEEGHPPTTHHKPRGAPACLPCTHLHGILLLHRAGQHNLGTYIPAKTNKLKPPVKPPTSTL